MNAAVAEAIRNGARDPRTMSTAQLTIRVCEASDCDETFIPFLNGGGGHRRRFCSERCQRRNRDRRLHGHRSYAEIKQDTAKRNARRQAAAAARRAERTRAADLRRMLRDLDALVSSLDRPCPCDPCRAARRQVRRQRWRDENPEYHRLYKRAYKVLRANAVGTCTHDQAQARFDYYGGCCAYCRTALSGEWHWDHVIPLSRGGTAWPSNLRPACPDCNRRKCALPLSEWKARGYRRVAS